MPVRSIRGSVVAVLAAARLVAAAGDEFLPNDPDLALQWGLVNAGQVIDGQVGVLGADVDAAGAWHRHQGTRPVMVAIVGRGVDSHPEFADRLLEGFATTGDLFDSRDGCGLDTQLAGIIAASTNDGIGIAGLHGLAQILPVRVGNGCTVIEEEAAEGITRATDAGAKVILVSLQFADGRQPLADAVSYAASRDVVMVAPAGGDAANTVAFPARFDGCIAVSATTNQDTLSPFSNFGAEVDIAAPGRGIWTTDRGGDYAFIGEGRDAAAAAAFVAGVAALLRSYNPDLTAAEIRPLLGDSADDLGNPGPDIHFGTGRLNARRALELALAPALRFEPVEPLPEVVVPGRPRAFDIRIVSVAEQPVPGSSLLGYRLGSTDFLWSALTDLGEGLYRATLPAAGCGATIQFYLVAAGDGGTLVFEPPGAPAVLHRADAIPRAILFGDDFEVDRGWVADGGDRNTGRWEVVAPVGTTAQPDFDFSPDDGARCLVTGQYFGGSPGLTDVDGGPVRVTSPMIPLTAANVEVRYARWFHSSGEGQPDFLTVEMSHDDGANWVTVETVPHRGQWEVHRFRLSEFPGVTGNELRVRFSVSDEPSDSLTEAAIDEFDVEAVTCTNLLGDTDADSDVDLTDYRYLHGCLRGPHQPATSGPCVSADLNADGRVDVRDAWGLWTMFGRTAD
jgi:hypothetical protein